MLEDLLFNNQKLFSDKIDESLHSLKGSCTTLWSLGLYALAPTHRSTPPSTPFDFSLETREPSSTLLRFFQLYLGSVLPSLLAIGARFPPIAGY